MLCINNSILLLFGFLKNGSVFLFKIDWLEFLYLVFEVIDVECTVTNWSGVVEDQFEQGGRQDVVAVQESKGNRAWVIGDNGEIREKGAVSLLVWKVDYRNGDQTR